MKKEDWVMKCGKEKGKRRLVDEVRQRHFITQSSISFLFATLHHQVFPFLSLCHTSSPSLPFPFSLTHFITRSSFSGKEKGKGRLVDEVWQRERKRKTG
jgi:hypothetical protein